MNSEPCIPLWIMQLWFNIKFRWALVRICGVYDSTNETEGVRDWSAVHSVGQAIVYIGVGPLGNCVLFCNIFWRNWSILCKTYLLCQVSSLNWNTVLWWHFWQIHYCRVVQVNGVTFTEECLNSTFWLQLRFPLGWYTSRLQRQVMYVSIMSKVFYIMTRGLTEGRLYLTSINW